MAKGSSFEREVCKQLSLWWSKGNRDDIFWRTAVSGARAKVRSKKNKKTFGQYGDVQATDPVGQRLIDACTIEIKRGYSKSTFADLIDKSKKAAVQPYEKFIKQAMEDLKNSTSYSWLLIVKRNRREAMIFMPFSMSSNLKKIGSNIRMSCPSVFLYCEFKDGVKYKIFGTTLTNFFKKVKPNQIVNASVLSK